MPSETNDSFIQRYRALAAWIAVCFFTGVATGLLFPPDAWYQSLTKPSFNLPNWIFGPVWSTLYVMMGVAAWRVWRTPASHDRARGITGFILQLAFNAAWTPVFFGLQLIGWAIVVVLLMWLAVAVTIFFFHRVDRIAAWLLAPLLAWVSFASVLNIVIWRLNP
jgi:tryptophan-rich sensory protein